MNTAPTVTPLVQPDGTYFHFLPENRRLRYSDNRLVQIGETLTAKERPLELCEYGMHASRRAINALEYAPGPVVCLVRLGSDVLHDTDKSVSSERTAIWMYDASRLLREFACDVAEIALLNERKAGREPDVRSFAAIEVMRRFMRGEASENERDAASAAASAAARDAAWAAASDAFNDRLTQMLLSAMHSGQGEFAETEALHV